MTRKGGEETHIAFHPWRVTVIKKFRGTYCGLYRALLMRETIRATRALSLANFSDADRRRLAIYFFASTIRGPPTSASDYARLSVK